MIYRNKYKDNSLQLPRKRGGINSLSNEDLINMIKR